METPAETTPPPLWKRALKNALFAAVVGAITGVVCGMVLPGMGEALFGAGGLEFFKPFAPEYLALFLGFSGGVSALLATGADKVAQSDNDKDTVKGKGKSPEIEESLTPTREISHSAALPFKSPPAIDSTGLLVTSPTSSSLQLTETPCTAVMDAIHESRLQALPEIAKMRLH